MCIRDSTYCVSFYKYALNLCLMEKPIAYLKRQTKTDLMVAKCLRDRAARKRYEKLKQNKLTILVKITCNNCRF